MGPRQIVVHVPNQSGQLARISELFSESGIDVKAVSVSTDGVEGVLAMVVNDHPKAMMALLANGYAATETPVIAAYAPDHPGGLKAVIKPLRDAGINIERLYLCVSRKEEHAVLILEVGDYERGVEALKANYVELIEGEFRF